MKILKPTQDDKDKLLKQFLKELEKTEQITDTFKCTLKVSEDKNEKVKLKFTLKAWYKITQYVALENTEVCWHGFVERDTLNNEYIVTDVTLYPQLVASVTVDSNDTEYPMWIGTMEPEKKNKMRLQGHSHVNMSVSPSGQDTSYYNEVLQALGNDDFYIFIIVNKKGDIHTEIYDKLKNRIYEDKDTSIEIIDENENLTELINTERKAYIKPKHSTSKWWEKNLNSTPSSIADERFRQARMEQASMEELEEYFGMNDPFYVSEDLIKIPRTKNNASKKTKSKKEVKK